MGVFFCIFCVIAITFLRDVVRAQQDGVRPSLEVGSVSIGRLGASPQPETDALIQIVKKRAPREALSSTGAGPFGGQSGQFAVPVTMVPPLTFPTLSTAHNRNA